MMKSFRIILFVFGVLIISNLQNVSAQSYPVQANLYVLAPYSQTYSDYYADGQQRMFVNVLLNDMNQSQLDVVLHFTITSNNLKLTTNPNAALPPVRINCGQLTRIEGSDLAQYLKSDIMLAEGRKADEFRKSGKLPEGHYEFKVEVAEYYRKARISAPAYSTAWIMQGEAPVWTMPQNGAKVDAINPQFMLFGWMTPDATGSSLANARYKFTLCEVPSQVTPSVAIKSANPLYSEELLQTTLVYGPDKPILELGKLYVCQVQVYDADGNATYKNNGYSEPLTFRYGEVCEPPTGLKHTDITKKGATINWNNKNNHSGYDVELREVADGDASEWYTWQVDGAEHKYEVKQLAPGSKYEYRVSATCGLRSNGIKSAYTDTKTFITSEAGNSEYDCSKIETPVKPADNTVYPYLEEGDEVTSAGFPFTILSITKNSDGIYSGQCSWHMPLWGITILCNFTDITINSLHEVLSGKIEATHDKIQAQAVSRLQNVAYMPIGTQVPASYTPDVVKTMDEVVDSVKFVNGQTAIYVAGKEPEYVSATDNVFVKSADGNYYAVEDGKIYPKPSNLDAEGNISLSYQEQLTATFSRGTLGPHYGFDVYSEEKKPFAGQYDQYVVHSKDKYASWMSMPQGSANVVYATIEGGTSSDMRFRMSGQDLPITKDSENENSVYVTVTNAGNCEAYYTTTDKKNNSIEVLAGQLNVATYPEQSVNLCIVEVNSTQYPYAINTLQNYLNQVYGASITKLNISSAKLTVAGFNGTLSDKDSGAMSAYNKDMKALVKATKKMSGYDKDTYYLLMVPRSSNSTLSGYMPVNSNIGFIFTEACNSQDAINRAIAHELGHGAFHLWHTFSTENKYVASQGATTNLMDYSNNATSTDLYKYQWDFIHNPEFVLFRGDDEEGEALEESVEIKRTKFELVNNDEESRFDDNDKNSCGKYPTYLNNNPIKEGARWYYTYPGRQNTLKINVTPSKSSGHVFLHSKDGRVVINDIKKASNPIVLSFSTNVSDTGMSIYAKQDSIKGIRIDGLNIISCKPKILNISIYLLQDSAKAHPPIVEKQDIENYINKIYSAINLTATLTFDTIKMNFSSVFDKNKDWELDKNTESSLLRRYNVDNKVGYKVYIIDLPITRPGLNSGEAIGGLAIRNTNYPMMNSSPIAIVSTFNNNHVPSSVAHELGHLVFGLYDVFLDPLVTGFNQYDDQFNLMDYVTAGGSYIYEDRKLRAYQVIDIESKTP